MQNRNSSKQPRKSGVFSTVPNIVQIIRRFQGVILSVVGWGLRGKINTFSRFLGVSILNYQKKNYYSIPLPEKNPLCVCRSVSIKIKFTLFASKQA